MKENVGRAFEIVRMAVRALSRSWATAKHRAACKIPIHVSRDEEIETAIAIVVEPAGARGPAVVHPGKLARDVTESTIAIVSIEAICFVSGDEEIDEAVVIVVRSGDAHAVTCAF